MTSRQATAWRRGGLVVSGEGEIAQLRLIAALRRAGVSARRVRALLRGLRSTAAGPPHHLTFAIRGDGNEVYVRHADGSWEGDGRPGQLLLIPDGDGALCATGVYPRLDPLFAVPPAAGPARHPRPAPADNRDAIRSYLASENRRPDR